MPSIPIVAELPDPRIDRTKRHSLSDILVLTLCGALRGVDNWVELELFCGAKLKWFRTFLDLPNGIPCHTTFGRVLSPSTARPSGGPWTWRKGLVIARRDRGSWKRVA